MRSLALLLVVLVVALASSPAFSYAKKTVVKKPTADTTPPTVEHTPLVKHDGTGPVLVDAHIVDDKSAVFEPTLLVRAAGAGPFMRVPMLPQPDNHYVAEVPKELLGGDVEYLIEAFDENGNGPARVGDESAPIRITRDVPVVVSKPPPPPPPPPAAPEDAGPSGLLIGAGIAVGVVLLAAGGGLAFYALRPPAPAVVNITVSGHAPFQGGGA